MRELDQRILEALDAIDNYDPLTSLEHPLDVEFKDMRNNETVLEAAIEGYWWAMKYIPEGIKKDDYVNIAVECYMDGVDPDRYSELKPRVEEFMKNADVYQIAKLQQLTDDGITYTNACVLLMDPSLSYTEMDAIAADFKEKNSFSHTEERKVSTKYSNHLKHDPDAFWR